MKISYSEKDELARRMIILKVVDLMFSETFNTGKELIASAESYFRKEYEVGNTYDKLITSYQITDAFTRFCLDLPHVNKFLKDNALETLESFEIIKEEPMEKDTSTIDAIAAAREKYFPKLFKHFSSKLKQPYEEAIESVMNYCEKNPDKVPGIGDGTLYRESVKVVLADTFYATLVKMKTDPASIVKALLKNLSKEDLGEVIKDAQSYINN